MNLQDFINKYNNKFVEVGGSSNAKNQCVDLANAWIDEGLGKRGIFGTNAKDYWAKADNDYKRINTNENPRAGDLVIWNIGSVGHIAISTGNTGTSGGVRRLEVFSQNYPLKTPAHIVDITDNNLIGYLRKEQMTAQDVFYLLEPWWRSTHGMANANKSSLMRECDEIVTRMNHGEVWAGASFRDRWWGEYEKDYKKCPKADCKPLEVEIANMKKSLLNIKKEVAKF